jgi:hypothetical protein
MTGLKDHGPATSGIALESVDGGRVDGVVVSNITMVNVRAPIFLRLGNRGRDMAKPVPGSLQNVSINNVVATNASLACSITGIPGYPVVGVSLSNVRITYAGGGPLRPANEPVPEVPGKYPCPRMFDALPAYGLYCRHVNDLTLSNLVVRFEDAYWRLVTEDSKTTKWITSSGIPTPSKPGRPGPALVCDDVNDLRIDGLRCRRSKEGDPLLRFVNVTRALVRGSVAPNDTSVFLEVHGPQTRDIALVGNVLTQARRPLLLGSQVPPDEVSVAGCAVRPTALRGR